MNDNNTPSSEQNNDSSPYTDDQLESVGFSTAINHTTPVPANRQVAGELLATGVVAALALILVFVVVLLAVGTEDMGKTFQIILQYIAGIPSVTKEGRLVSEVVGVSSGLLFLIIIFSLSAMLFSRGKTLGGFFFKYYAEEVDAGTRPSFWRALGYCGLMALAPLLHFLLGVFGFWFGLILVIIFCFSSYFDSSRFKRNWPCKIMGFAFVENKPAPASPNS